MMFYLFLLFTVVPLAELAVLVWLGGETEWWVPILIVLADAVLGAALVRWQGLRTLQRIQDDMAAGRMPGDSLIDGLLVLIGAVLLITPGVLTDVAGFALLIPPIRVVVKRGAKAWIARHVRVQVAGGSSAAWGGGPGTQRNHAAGNDEIIDARVISSRVEDAP